MTNEHKRADRAIYLSPSLMCGNVLNLEATVSELNQLRIDAIHIDLIDGSFSPSMPLGLEMIAKIKELSKHPLDVHIMTNNTEFFIEEMIKIGVDSITFHVETTIHVDYYVNLIKRAGIKVGIALNPATSLSVLDYILPQLDKVVLMLINPGYANHADEMQAPYSMQKINDLRSLISSKNLDTTIQVDGRVSFEVIPDLIKNGANDLVLGSKSLFQKDVPLSENLKKLEHLISFGDISHE